jgi:hypothetical protein
MKLFAEKIKMQQAHLGAGKTKVVDFCEDISGGQSSSTPKHMVK